MKKFCPNCGSACTAQKFCGECGHQLSGEVRPTNQSTASNTSSQPTNYQNIKWEYNTSVIADVKKLGDVAQETKTGFVRQNGTQSKADVIQQLRKTSQTTIIEPTDGGE